jgi:septal ring factor EnvC (AmiA/AmiB activator)
VTRQHKTPRQRAEETLATAQRVRDRIARQLIRTQKQLDALVHDLDEADDRLAYAKQDPALKGSTTTSTTNQSGDTA